MSMIHLNDVVAASLAAAGACLACSIPGDFLRRFPLWAYKTYGRGALLLPLLAVMVGTLIAGVAVEGDINSDGGIALVAAASFLGLILASALLRFWLADYRKR
ncbi:MAG: hypothetical protein COC14_09915 [Burkholderiaceae bacterium]|jgi:hypothetical protein|uniref:Uncharacterized protein n=1 Tax=Cupriavidus metallidurans TaxID=119219 RepID=A0A482IPA6_9BURK|nr:MULTISPECIES: hypothetical protein [Cupriavidus]KWR79771.1 hypothetical protein RN01_20680 [Cupriavidus sp. SHE]PCH55126.1 MAG: hypothetical protein COC14_09915 [Burkholderiaceae bacterium]QBP08989.1 hypothetical protein DDF84_004070 [Cupriavidus metallidurans]QWC89421.1 hypothetical protein KB891_04220 [Cupriavidus metallidurans]